MKAKVSLKCVEYSGNCVLLLIALLCLLTMTAFALNELTNRNEDDSIFSSIITAVQSSEEQQSTPTYEAGSPRKERSPVAGAPTKSPNATARYYYEEQRPVVVHAESARIMAYPQPARGPPKYNSNEEDPYYEAAGFEADDLAEDNGTEGADDDGGGEDFHDDVRGYYDDQSSPHYDASNDGSDSRAEGSADQQSSEASSEQVGEGRSAQPEGYDSYYRHWHYATPTPLRRKYQMDSVGDKRKLTQPPMSETDPYAAYDAGMIDYDYPPGLEIRPQQQQEQPKIQQQQHHALQQYRPQNHRPQNQRPQQSKSALQTRPATTTDNTETTFLSVFRSLKTMWDIYQAFSTAWNAIAAHRQQQEQLQLQKEQQQQQRQQQQAKSKQPQKTKQPPRINSKKPPKFDGSNDKVTERNSSRKTTKADNKTTTKIPIVTTTTTPATTVTLTKAKLEALKVSQPESEEENLRKKRESSTTDVGEGRYIKGDPLKGYYDFVITEGSYKFWAVFQVGTAILIIYSTFAAIYYSKVNPLVSDYDYTDYLGGSRALAGGSDLDFVDDSDDAPHHRHWYDWTSQAGHSLKFILDAIDKLPADHADGAAAVDAAAART